jgi:hypothetical protein
VPAGQKYSRIYTSLGVEDDESVLEGCFIFPENISKKRERVGSSYATPIATAYYFFLTNNLDLSNFEYYERNTNLKSKVKSSLVFKIPR